MKQIIPPKYYPIYEIDTTFDIAKSQICYIGASGDIILKNKLKHILKKELKFNTDLIKSFYLEYDDRIRKTNSCYTTTPYKILKLIDLV